MLSGLLCCSFLHIVSTAYRSVLEAGIKLHVRQIIWNQEVFYQLIRSRTDSLNLTCKIIASAGRNPPACTSGWYNALQSNVHTERGLRARFIFKANGGARWSATWDPATRQKQICAAEKALLPDLHDRVVRLMRFRQDPKYALRFMSAAEVGEISTNQLTGVSGAGTEWMVSQHQEGHINIYKLTWRCMTPAVFYIETGIKNKHYKEFKLLGQESS